MTAHAQDTCEAGRVLESAGLEPRGEAFSRQLRLEGRWRGIFDNSAIGIALADLNGRILTANAALQQMLGYSELELQSYTFLQITHEEDRETNRAQIGRAPC